MIKDKYPPKEDAVPEDIPTFSVGTEPEEVAENPFVNMYQAVRRAILTIRENPDDPSSPAFFRTIAIDNGQFARIVRNENTEYETAFPAVFIHFVNVRYLVQQQRIGEGRATMRVRFILDTLNGARVRPVHRLPAPEHRHTGCQGPGAGAQRAVQPHLFRYAADDQHAASLLDRLRGMVPRDVGMEIPELGGALPRDAALHAACRCAGA